jgi:hypothetical protein
VALFPTYTSRHPAHVRQPPEQPVPAAALIAGGWQPQNPHLASRCLTGGRLSEARIAADLACRALERFRLREANQNDRSA